jgi:chemotaxis protein methyltransferase CheR
MSDPMVADYEAFKRKVYAKTSLNLDAYKQGQMERRLRSLMERSGARTFQQYYCMLERSDALLCEFMDRVTINVSELFRNPEQFVVLEKKVIPDLLSRSQSLAVWSAGCSHGQEPFSLAICLAEAAPKAGHKIIATDIDDRSLENARKGVFSPLDCKNIDRRRLAAWFAREEDKLIADRRLRDMIRFGKLDLLKDAFAADLDLIVCRNVVIYFTDDAKARLYQRFFDALRPGGYLFVGGTERVSGYLQIGYSNPFPFFYQKPTNL